MILIFILIVTATSFASPLKIACLINGELGDKSFFDSAAEGLKTLENENIAETKIIEMEYNTAAWEPTLDDISAFGGYEIIVVGTWPMVDPLIRIAGFYPENRYILYDAKVDFSQGDLSNIYAISYKQNEGSFLAGALAALVSQSESLSFSNDSQIIGVLGGVDSPIVNDFIVGYIKGAQYVNKNIKVLVSYAGIWNDPAKGRELANVMYQKGADVIFNVAANTGNGIYPAAVENKAWSIGVDSDAHLVFEASHPEYNDHILTSMLKDIGQSLVKTINLYEKGELEFGQCVSMGIKEGVIGLAYNDYFIRFLEENPDIEKQLSEIKEKILNGEIHVPTAIGKSSDYVYGIINAAN
ncbi:MAG: BMP family ABC transporter substrate-binding protein [Bacteroidota bacterium]